MIKIVNENRGAYLIVGAGHQGLAMAAHFALSNEKVFLWNRTEAHIDSIIKEHVIVCNGIVEGRAYIDKVSTKLESLITDTIFVTTPTTAYKEIAERLASLLMPNTVIFLNPGRTFGAIEFMEYLQKNGCKNIPTIVETQSIVYTCRREKANKSYIYALKDNVKMAHVGTEITLDDLLNRIPRCIRSRFVLVDSVLETSLGNIGMILHCAPVIMNVGWIESDKHAFYYYYDGISKSVGLVLEKMDHERMAVAKAMDISTISLVDWFYQCYGVHGISIYDCIQNNNYYKKIDAPNSIQHRYLDEDVPNGLVPIEYLGKNLGVDVSTITVIIDMAEVIRGVNYRKIGRCYDIKDIIRYTTMR